MTTLCLYLFYKKRDVIAMGTNEELLAYEIEKALEKAESVEEYKKIIRIALDKWLSNLQSGDIKLSSVSDIIIPQLLVNLKFKNKIALL